MAGTEPVHVVLVTAPDPTVGARIGRSLVEEGLAACANLVPGVRSIYRWQGAVHDDAEVLLIVKTRASLVDALAARVRALHPYELPEVLALPVVGGSVPYLDWVRGRGGGLGVSLADALEAAAGALPAEADAIRPANGDAARLLAALPGDGAARVAAWLIAERPVDAEELAELWCEEPKGQAALLAVPEEGLPKEGRKLLRRLRHRLRSRGVATPEPAPPPTVARLPELEDALSGAFVTGLDPVGARQVWWLEPHPSGGTRLFECVIDDARGVLAFEVYTPTRSELRRFLKGLSANNSFPAFTVEVATAKALVRRAAERQAGEHSTPRRWIEWRARLGALEGARLPGDLVGEALGASAGREGLAAAEQLVGEGRVGPWPPLRETMTPVVERIRTALDSPLVVSGATRREQVARLVEEAAGELFDADASAIAAQRFRESAFTFWRRGDEPAARACLAAAGAFETEPGAANPVARAFVELWLRPLLAAATGEPPAAAKEPEPSLLVRP